MKNISIEKLKQTIKTGYSELGNKVIVIDDKSYTGTELSKEIESESEIGIKLIENTILLTIDLINRNKEKL